MRCSKELQRHRKTKAITIPINRTPMLSLTSQELRGHFHRKLIDLRLMKKAECKLPYLGLKRNSFHLDGSEGYEEDLVESSHLHPTSVKLIEL